MSDSLLPIGSVVQISEFEYPLMVIGFYPEIDEQSYDYLGVVYPQGLLETAMTVTFNDTAIDEVLYKGFLDKSGAEALEAAKGYMDNIAEMNQEIIEAVLEYAEDHQGSSDDVENKVAVTSVTDIALG